MARRGLRNLLVVAEANALDVDRCIERGQQFTHVAADSLHSQHCGRSGVVVLFWPSSVVGAAWPPVML